MAGGRIADYPKGEWLQRNSHYFWFFGTAFVAFVLATFGSEVVSRAVILNDPLHEVVSEYFERTFSVAGLVWNAMALLPFAIAAWFSVLLTEQRSLRRGLVLYTVSLVALMYVYFLGYLDAQEYLMQQMWTASILAVGALPIKSTPVLLLSLGIWLLMLRYPATPKDQ